MKVISILTEKGGVGKTTTSIHLGASFAENGKKTLLIDFDAQRNLSVGYNISKESGYSIKNFLDGDFDNFSLHKKNEHLFILSGDRNIENGNYKRDVLSKNIENFKSLGFDYIIIDCPPRPITNKIGLGEIALNASDYVISPIEAEQYSIEGINELLPSIERIKQFNPRLQFLGFFFNKVLENSINFKKYRKIALLEAKGFFFMNYVRRDMAIERAKELGETVYTVAPNSRVTNDYIALVTEIINKIKK